MAASAGRPRTGGPRSSSSLAASVRSPRASPTLPRRPKKRPPQHRPSASVSGGLPTSGLISGADGPSNNHQSNGPKHRFATASATRPSVRARHIVAREAVASAPCVARLDPARGRRPNGCRRTSRPASRERTSQSVPRRAAQRRGGVRDSAERASRSLMRRQEQCTCSLGEVRHTVTRGGSVRAISLPAQSNPFARAHRAPHRCPR